MLTCITCSKQHTEDGERGDGGGARGSPHAKDASLKSLTAQIKDMALKMSSTYKQCKPCPSLPNPRKGLRPFPESDTISEGVPYPYYSQNGSSSSTPAWDFATPCHHPSVADPRFDRTPQGLASASLAADVVLKEDEPKEWMALVEPGVQITFVSLPSGANDLKRIRFSREMFDKRQAQTWWGENYDRIMELYNVHRLNSQALHTPSRSEDERISSYSRLESARESSVTSLNKKWATRNYDKHSPTSMYESGDQQAERPSGTTISSRDETSVLISNASEAEIEWIEEDEPGVSITIRQMVDGTRELRRIRFSRERFGESRAKIWWEENRERIQDQYLEA